MDETIREREFRDDLPVDLDPHAYVGPYQFPDNSRRRVPAVIYLAMTIGVLLAAVIVDGSPHINGGTVAAAVGVAAVGLYQLQAGWALAIDETDALVVATRAVGFPVGHASAQMAWRGIRSRPMWRILVYSNESPPTQRGLVFIDGVDGRVVDTYVEKNPEEWGSGQG
ncbi:MAG: hypothetical protein VX833_01685 [Actinomycetota bacterium]|nr:hypothetical protein [Actinomycetota bacterium]